MGFYLELYDVTLRIFPMFVFQQVAGIMEERGVDVEGPSLLVATFAVEIQGTLCVVNLSFPEMNAEAGSVSYCVQLVNKIAGHGSEPLRITVYPHNQESHVVGHSFAKVSSPNVI